MELDEKTRETLLARARVLSQRGLVGTRELAGEPVAVLSVGGESMGLPVSYLQSIIRLPPVTPVPHLPPWIPGVIQVHGTVVSVIDIARWLGLTQSTESPYLAILKLESRQLGVFVAGVAGVRQIFTDELVEQQTAQRNASDLPIRFTTRDLVAVIDVERLFVLADQRAARQSVSAVLAGGGVS